MCYRQPAEDLQCHSRVSAHSFARECHTKNRLGAIQYLGVRVGDRKKSGAAPTTFFRSLFAPASRLVLCGTKMDLPVVDYVLE